MSPSFRRYFLACLCVMSAFLLVGPEAFAGIGFQPVNQDELKMTSDPQAPGAAAVILYRQVDRDDNGRNGHGGLTLVGSESNTDRYEDTYIRIKILTEEGRKWANVEIPMLREAGNIGVIGGRTIHPDGTIINFDGKVYDKTVFKGEGVHYLAKTFALPDVQVGSVIEYYYTIMFREGFVFNTQWILSQELFTRRAKFSLRPYASDYLPLSFQWTEKLPAGTASPKQGNDGIVRMEATNIAPFEAEEFMPPATELQARVDFIYSFQPFESEPGRFWQKYGKKHYDDLEHFVGKPGALNAAVGQMISASDPPEVKLQKIYARVQELRNTSYEVRKTRQQLERMKEKAPDMEKGKGKPAAETAEQILAQGYGDSGQLVWLYLALLRAAGFEPRGVLVSNRRELFFNPANMNSNGLTARAVLVSLNGKDLLLNPGAPFAPFGLLPWEQTSVPALTIDKDGGRWVQTPLPATAASRIERKADLTLSDNGMLEGKVTLTFTGLEGLRRRFQERNEDDAARKNSLEEELKRSIPVGAEVELSNTPDWGDSESPLVAEFKLKVEGWASVAGGRVMLPVGLFAASERSLFQHAQRVHPVYFEYLSEKADDVTVMLPAGWHVKGIPSRVDKDLHAVAFASDVEADTGKLRFTRKLDINVLNVDVKYYPALRSFFQAVKTGDDQQVLLQPGTAAGS